MKTLWTHQSDEKSIKSKRYKDMKKLLMTLIALPMLMMSCNDEMALSEETVEVSFEAEIPAFVGTRAGDGLTVNKLVCAVFENGQEIKGHRTTIPVNSASGIKYSPRLVKGRTYQVVFWAMKDANYNVDNLTAISRSTTGSTNEADYDAFTATVETNVDNSTSVPVTLTRPLAQLNIGITEDDWNAVANSATFNQTPASCTITYTARDTFNALIGEAVGPIIPTVIRTSTAGGTLTVVDNNGNSADFKRLGSYYVLMAEENQATIDITYSVVDSNDSPIRENVLIPFVPMQRNYKTNIVGGLLTGTVNYNVTISEGFNTEENNKTIE